MLAPVPAGHPGDHGDRAGDLGGEVLPELSRRKSAAPQLRLLNVIDHRIGGIIATSVRQDGVEHPVPDRPTLQSGQRHRQLVGQFDGICGQGDPEPLPQERLGGMNEKLHQIIEVDVIVPGRAIQRRRQEHRPRPAFAGGLHSRSEALRVEAERFGGRKFALSNGCRRCAVTTFAPSPTVAVTVSMMSASEGTGVAVCR